MSTKVDIREDKNLFILDPKKALKPQFTTSLLMEDLAKSAEDALSDARDASWQNWLNSEPLLVGHYDEDSGKSYLFFISEQLKNKIIVFYIWDYILLPCIRSVEYIKEWNYRYSPAGLVTIGIHSPMFSFGQDKGNVQDAIRALGVTFPIVLDSELTIWKSLENRYWPRLILLNEKQETCADVVGEGGCIKFEQEIQKLLRKQSPGLACLPILKPLYPLDEKGSEVFFGFKHRSSVLNPQWPSSVNDETRFQGELPGDIPENMVWLTGDWVITGESLYSSNNMKSAYKGELSFTINFKAKNVYMIACSRPRNAEDVPSPIRVQLLLDKKPVLNESFGKDLSFGEGRRSQVIFKNPRLYSVLKNLSPGPHELKLILDDESSDTAEIFGFSFEDT